MFIDSRDRSHGRVDTESRRLSAAQSLVHPSWAVQPFYNGCTLLDMYQKGISIARLSDKVVEPCETRVMALTFGTLLSSQGADAHRRGPFRPFGGNPRYITRSDSHGQTCPGSARSRLVGARRHQRAARPPCLGDVRPVSLEPVSRPLRGPVARTRTTLANAPTRFKPGGGDHGDFSTGRAPRRLTGAGHPCGSHQPGTPAATYRHHAPGELGAREVVGPARNRLPVDPDRPRVDVPA